MREKNTEELAEVLGKTHLSEFDRYCSENKDSMNPDNDAFSIYIKNKINCNKKMNHLIHLF